MHFLFSQKQQNYINCILTYKLSLNHRDIELKDLVWDHENQMYTIEKTKRKIILVISLITTQRRTCINAEKLTIFIMH